MDEAPDRPPYAPAMPAVYSREDDVNPVCGHHRRNQCVACGSCTWCDGCYCNED